MALPSLWTFSMSWFASSSGLKKTLRSTSTTNSIVVKSSLCMMTRYMRGRSCERRVRSRTSDCCFAISEGFQKVSSDVAGAVAELYGVGAACFVVVLDDAFAQDVVLDAGSRGKDVAA